MLLTRLLGWVSRQPLATFQVPHRNIHYSQSYRLSEQFRDSPLSTRWEKRAECSRCYFCARMYCGVGGGFPNHLSKCVRVLFACAFYTHFTRDATRTWSTGQHLCFSRPFYASVHGREQQRTWENNTHNNWELGNNRSRMNREHPISPLLAVTDKLFWTVLYHLEAIHSTYKLDDINKHSTFGNFTSQRIYCKHTTPTHHWTPYTP
jgi:hypothetical protein